MRATPRKPAQRVKAPTVRRAYSYLRFSTPEQQRGHSFKRQSEMTAAYLRSHPELVLDTSLSLNDLGVSAYRGKNVTSGALGKFLEAVEAEQVPAGSVLLVESLDRVSRQYPLLAIGTLQSLCAHGITVVTLSDMQEYTMEKLLTSQIALIMSVLTFQRANEESATKGRRLKAAWSEKRKRASEKALTAVCPAWMELNRTTGKFELIPERARVVKRIFRDALKGHGQWRIAESLNSEGVPVFGDGTAWRRSYVSRILANVACVGTYIPHTVEEKDGKRVRTPTKAVPRYYPSVVSNDTFQSVQAMKDGGTRSPLRGRNARVGTVHNILGGLCKCGVCGGSVIMVNKGKRGNRSLVCESAKIGKGCEYRSTRLDVIEDALLRDADMLFATRPSSGVGAEALDREIDETQRQIEGTEDALDSLLNALQAGKSVALADRVRQVEDELDSLRTRHAELVERSAITSNKLVDRRIADLETALASSAMDRAETNALMRQVFAKVIIDRKQGQLEMHWKHGGVSHIAFAFPETA